MLREPHLHSDTPQYRFPLTEEDLKYTWVVMGKLPDCFNRAAGAQRGIILVVTA